MLHSIGSEQPMKRVLTLCAAVLAFCASNGCSSRAAYEAVRANERNRCNELPETERQRCLDRTQDDFDEYQRKKSEVK